jgi:hypothetical protein
MFPSYVILFSISYRFCCKCRLNGVKTPCVVYYLYTVQVLYINTGTCIATGAASRCGSGTIKSDTPLTPQQCYKMFSLLTFGNMDTGQVTLPEPKRILFYGSVINDRNLQCVYCT